ncbi:MAG: LysE family translocator [Fibrobacter sp.]|nr:LysE family translocator [Fibrobacter sp.]
MLEFFIAAIVVALAPGPDNLFVLAQSATHGAKAGFCIICGLCTGILVQTGLLVVGVSALIAASPVAFFVIQCLGAAYLVYLAYKSFQVRAGVVVSSEFGVRNSELDKSQSLSARRLYLRGIIMNLTNPKAILFALSFIPPAVKMDSPLSPSVQMVILGSEFVVATFIVFGTVALLAGAVKKFMLNSPKANRNLNWFSGCVFVLLAVALFAL